MLFKGLIKTTYTTRMWNVFLIKYLIDVKFLGYGNNGYIKVYPYF